MIAGVALLGERKSADDLGRLNHWFAWVRVGAIMVLATLVSMPLIASAQTSDGPEDATPLVMTLINRLQGGRLDDPNFVRRVVREVLDQDLVRNSTASEQDPDKVTYDSFNKLAIIYIITKSSDKNRVEKAPYYLAAELEVFRQETQAAFHRPNEFIAPRYKYPRVYDFPSAHYIEEGTPIPEFYNVLSTKNQQHYIFLRPSYVRACRQLSQISTETSWTAARKVFASLS